ncbi:MAG TPA: aldolase/citrate lyase family protein [Cyclobacteriaceae bacterium]|nr:aldolase/citrate lyase family protein [Cyclobacteriaceae bacterium]
MPYPIFEKWRSSTPTVNIFLRIPSGYIAELVSTADFDAITLDLQHGLVELEHSLPMLQAIRDDKFPMVRIAANDPAAIMKLLDIGAKGIICPMINTGAEAEKFVSACFYPPVGVRSFGPIRANLPASSTYMQDYAREIVTFAQIETRESLDNLEEIAATKNLSGLYVGPYDLSISLGMTKMADFSDPTFMEHIKRVLAVAKKHKLITAIQAYKEDEAAMLANMGYSMVTPVEESATLLQGVKEKLERVRSKFK